MRPVKFAKPEQYADHFFDIAESLGVKFTQSGNIHTNGGKNISKGKVAAIYRRYGDECHVCPSCEFKSDSIGLKHFRMIAEKALG
jgi:tRNA(Ile2) C34 agmatinyltransferase TiaS